MSIGFYFGKKKISFQELHLIEFFKRVIFYETPCTTCCIDMSLKNRSLIESRVLIFQSQTVAEELIDEVQSCHHQVLIRCISLEKARGLAEESRKGTVLSIFVLNPPIWNQGRLKAI